MFVRGLYNGKTWDQRLQQRETKRQLVRTHEFLEERAWEKEDSVFADIAGRKRARSKDAGTLLSKARKVFVCYVYAHAWLMRLLIEENQAKESYALRKVCLTKAVFMALLKDNAWHHVVSPLPQRYADGTVFEVHDIRKLCSVLMRTYMLCCKDASARQMLCSDANEIMCFLDNALALAEAGGSLRLGGVSSRSCPPWLCLRNSIKEANVQPMALVARNARLASYQEDGARKKMDWYLRKEWFMAVSIVSQQSARADVCDAGTEGTDPQPCNLRGYEQWGECENVDEGDTSAAALLLSGRKLPVSECGSAAQMVRRRQNVESVGRRTKRTASPFDAAVVEVVRKALAMEA